MARRVAFLLFGLSAWVEMLAQASAYTRPIQERVDSAFAVIQIDTLRFADGALYIGQLSDTLVSGFGIMYYPDSTVYVGEWKSDFWHGQGKLSFPDGDEYEGSFARHTMEGRGTYRYADGSYYTGDFWNNMFDGNGTFNNSNGDAYSGGWLEDKKHGHGLQYNSSTNEYKTGYYYNNVYVGETKTLFDQLESGQAYLNADNKIAYSPDSPQQQTYYHFEEETKYVGVSISSASHNFMGFGLYGYDEKCYLGIELCFQTSTPCIGRCMDLYDEDIKKYDLESWKSYTADERFHGEYTKMILNACMGWHISEKLMLGGGCGIGLVYSYKNCMTTNAAGSYSGYDPFTRYYKTLMSGAKFNYKATASYIVPITNSKHKAFVAMSWARIEGLALTLGVMLY